jgi:SAM-dependent methyltransferase
MRTHRSVVVMVALIALLGPPAGISAQTPAPAAPPAAPAPAAPPAAPAPAAPPAAPAPAAKDLDVPYVPTPEQVVAEMLRVAGVGKRDVLYDLGSGDGRIVVTAAKRFGTRGTGIDIDPLRVQESNENARAAGVSNRVRFIQGDIFDADIRPATVVTLYLLPAVNMKLRPKLLRELRPGTRVVSHNYDMGDWKPEKTIQVRLSGSTHTVYYWVVPEKGAESR